MNRTTAAAISAVLLMGMSVALGAASPPLDQPTMPPVSSGRGEIDQLKMLSDRLDKLESRDAQKSAQIAALTAQVTALQASLTIAQANVSALQSHAGDYVPIAGPGNCASHGYMNAGSLSADPSLVVYSWGNCSKAP